jgi:glycerol dehydrogenase-like iron-containing ADH family enzyme
LSFVIEGKLLCNKLVGHFDQALADELMRRGNTLIAKYGELAVFSDWFHMTSYETSCRRTMTEWGVGLGRGLKCFHVIAGTRLVKMGLAVASIVVPTLRAHDGMASFIAAYQEAQRGQLRP